MLIEGKDISYADFDLSDYVVGYDVSTVSVTGKNAMTTMDGFQFKDEIAARTKVVCHCLPLTEEQLSEVMQAVLPYPKGTLYFFDSDIGYYREMTANRTIGSRKYRGRGADGNYYWTGFSLTFEGLAAFEVP